VPEGVVLMLIKTKNMNLKNLGLFYLMIVVPIATLLLLLKEGQISSQFFTIGLLVYFLVYHPLISGLRLVQSGKIEQSKFWYNFIPGWNTKYFSFLFFNKYS
jgi:uncharacterized membrane protein